MVVSAAGQQHLVAIWLILQFASAGVLDHAGIKVPFFTFFSHDSGIRTTEPPLNMLLAMAMAAFGCLFLGIYPQPLYQLLPYAVDYVPYTAAHVVGQLQLLMFGALAFCLLMFSGFYPAELRAINLDSDWFYRVGARWFYRLADRGLNTLNARLHQAVVLDLSRHLSRWFARGPAHVVWALVLPLQRIMGREGQEVEAVKQKVYTAIQSGTIPLGFSAAAATILLVGLFWLT
jgi:multicomponent Na+:H+ antiporter subunit D